MKRILFLTALTLSIAFEGCTQKKDYVVTISTPFGDMIAILYDETPKHKENFIKLAKEHYYDSLLFHRIIQGFMIQGGDPESKNAQRGQRLGNGGPGYTVEAEFNPKFFHEKGALSAARLGDAMNPTKASSGSQFYIVHGRTFSENELKIDNQKFTRALQQFFQNPENKEHLDSLRSIQQEGDAELVQSYLVSLKPTIEAQLGISVENEIDPEKLKAYTTVGGAPHLDGQYTVFGKVISGLDVIDKIAAQPKDQFDRPVEDIPMTVRVEEMKKSKIEKQFGYKYPEE